MYSTGYLNKRRTDRVWRDVDMAELIFYSGIWLGGLRKITKI
jgi:hypothetical protein